MPLPFTPAAIEQNPATQRPARRAFHYTGISFCGGYFPMRCCLLVLAAWLTHVAAAAGESKMLLRQNWAIQSSAEVHESGVALSTPGFRLTAWHPATLPTTVFRDRKSTRLNSSHRCISYAVF